MKRILIGGSYVGALAAGAVASAQLWMHAFTVDEPSAIRELAVPGSHVRSVPALVTPARPHAVTRPPASPSPFSSFTPVFISTGPPATATVRGPIAPAGGTPIVPAPSTPAPGQPAPGSGGTAGSTPSIPPSASGPAPATSPAPAAPTSTQGAPARATPAVPARSAKPPAPRPATPATPAIPPSQPAKHGKAKPEKHAKPAKPPKQKDTSAPLAAPPAASPPAASSDQPGHGNDGDHGNGNGKAKGNGKK